MTQNILFKFGKRIKKINDQNYKVEISQNNFLKDLNTFKEKGFISLTDINCLDQLNLSKIENQSRFKLSYLLTNLDLTIRLRADIYIEKDEEIPTVDSLWENAKWFERELLDLFGIRFSDRKYKRLFNEGFLKGHPLRKDFDQSKEGSFSEKLERNDKDSGENVDLWEKVSSNYPGQKGTFNLLAKFSNDMTTSIELDLGYTHRGVEKLCEKNNYNQIIHLVERLNFNSSALNSIGWCKAIEEMLEVNLPDKAKALRMIIGELARVFDHLNNIAQMLFEMNLNDYHCLIISSRELISYLFEKYIGKRIHLSFVFIGGVRQDVDDQWITDCFNILSTLMDRVNSLSKGLCRNSVFRGKMKGGKISKKDALAWGGTGPSLRASGVNYDLRKNDPYYFYQDVNFEIPLGPEGTAFDRLLVRIEEIRQSMKIVMQLLENLPGGKIADDLYNSVDMAQRVILKNKEEHYSASEVANGELGFSVYSDGKNIPYRVKIKSPSFCNMQIFSELAINEKKDFLLPFLTSLNIVASEIDR